MAETSIVLLAIGKRGYGYAAHNLALSLRHYGCSYPVILYAQPETIDCVDHSVFDKIVILNEKYYTWNGNFAPAYGKINAFAEMPTKHVLYIDVDSLCLKNIDPLIEQLKQGDREFSTIWMGEGHFGDSISYDAWSKHDYAFNFFDLDKNTKWITVQSSLAYFRNSEKTRELMNALKYYYQKGYSFEGLKEAWGKKYLPDELFLSGVISKYGLDIRMPEAMFFAGRNNPDVTKDYKDIVDKYYFLAMYGGGGIRALTLPRYQDWYSAMGRVMSKQMGKIFFNHKYIMNDKILSA